MERQPPLIPAATSAITASMAAFTEPMLTK
jgi:hypothetical protein